MKIAFVTQPWDQVLPSIGGYSSIPILTYQFARRLVQSNEVIIYGKRTRSQQKAQHDDEGIQYRRILVGIEDRVLSKPFKLLYRLLGNHDSKRPFFSSNFYYPGYALLVARDLKKQQCDIIHIHNFSQFVPVIRAFNPKAKIVLHMHCEWLTQLDQKMIGERLRHVDLVISCSEYISEKIRRRFPEFANRCKTVFNGVNVDHFSKENARHLTVKNDIKNLLFVGRVSPEKGVHILVEAFKQVVKRYPQAQLQIAGPVGSAPVEFIATISDEDRVRDLTPLYLNNYLAHLQAKLSVDEAKQVSFLGFVPHLQLIELYQTADVFVFPSVWNEPFGMPPIEAMVNEVPVVATRSGGITEIVADGKTGFLVERDDVSALAEAILHLLKNEALRKSMGKRARQRVVEHFSWKKISKDLLHYYRSVYDDQIS